MATSAAASSSAMHALTNDRISRRRRSSIQDADLALGVTATRDGPGRVRRKQRIASKAEAEGATTSGVESPAVPKSVPAPTVPVPAKPAVISMCRRMSSAMTMKTLPGLTGQAVNKGSPQGPAQKRRPEIQLEKVREQVEGYYEAQRKRKPKLLLDPRESRFLSRWDGMTTIALIYTALVTPFEIAMLNETQMVLFVINRTVDTIFAFDIGVNFLTMTPPAKGGNESHWIADRRVIAVNYFRSWFAIDVLSIAVSIGDVVSLFVNDESAGSGAEGAADIANTLVLLKILRVLRLIKMVRLVRASRMWKRWETRNAVNYHVVALVSCILGIVLSSHWIACVWSLQTMFKDRRDQSWLGRGSIVYCTYNETSADVECVGPGTIYVAAMHFAVMTITSIGYGDIVPTDTSEQLVGLLLMILAGVQWASAIGTLCAVLADSADRQQFKEDVDALNTYMAEHGVDTHLRQRLREYFHQSVVLRRHQNTQKLLTQMSPLLQQELVQQTNGYLIDNIRLLRDTEDEFKVEISLNLVATVFSPMEKITSGYLTIITRGMALANGRVLNVGCSLGEDSFLASEHLRSPSKPIAVIYTECYMIAPEELLAIAQKYPDTHHMIRSRIVYFALRRELVWLADHMRAKRRASMGSGLSSSNMAIKKLSSLDDVRTELVEAQRAIRLAGNGGEESGVPTANEMHGYHHRRHRGHDAKVQLQIKQMRTEQLQLREEMASGFTRIEGVLEQLVLRTGGGAETTTSPVRRSSTLQQVLGLEA